MFISSFCNSNMYKIRSVKCAWGQLVGWDSNPQHIVNRDALPGTWLAQPAGPNLKNVLQIPSFFCTPLPWIWIRENSLCMKPHSFLLLLFPTRCWCCSHDHSLQELSKQIEGHTICALGDAAAWPVQVEECVCVYGTYTCTCTGICVATFCV